MMWQEIRLAAFILALCATAAEFTGAIYQRSNGTTTSAWLLLPLLALVAAVILTSEFRVKRAVAKEIGAGGPVTTWSPRQQMTGITMVAYIRSSPPAAHPDLRQEAGAGGVVTMPDREAQCIARVNP